jgi:hypothetical protein
MGQSGEDVQLSPAARKLFPYQIECKNKDKTAVHTWYDQCKEHGTHEPLLVIKENGNIPLAVISLDHFFYLLESKSQSNETS